MSKDEVYVVMSGAGQFICGDARHAFAAGDVLFVPAGVEHRFVDFTDDFNRHFPDSLQIHGDHTQIAPPFNWPSLRSRPIT